MAIALSELVAPREILAVVVHKVHVMQRMMRWAIDYAFERVADNHIAVVDRDCPEVDKDEQTHVGRSMQREEIHEDVVR